MRLLRLLLRVYSYAALAALSVAALVMSAIILASPHHTITIGWLPWPGDQLGDWLAGFGVLGVALVVLACAGRLRWLLTFYSAAAAYIIVKGLFSPAWHFDGPAGLALALWITAALALAVVGAIPISTASR